MTEPTLSLDDVRQALAQPLPGREAHDTMTPTPRHVVPDQSECGTECRKSGVLVLLYPHAGELHFVLTRRSDNLRHHRGQVSLPGGGQEGNEALEQTALRETGEELGVPPRGIKILGGLSSFYVSPSNNYVHPFVAYSPVRFSFSPDPTEVADIQEVPLALLLDPSIRRIDYWDDARFPEPRQVPYFDFYGWIVWGVTAMILAELLVLLESHVNSNAPSGRRSAEFVEN